MGLPLRASTKPPGGATPPSTVGTHPGPITKSIPRPIHMRASAIIARADYVSRTFGEGANAAVLAAMEPAHAATVRGAVVPSLWVSFDAVMAYVEAIDRVHGRGDLALAPTLARHSARVNMPILYKIFYKLGSVEYLMSKAAAVWSAQFDSGSATSKPIPGGVSFAIEGFARPTRTLCRTLDGWSQEMLALSGAALVGVRESRCRLRGDAACEFEIRYRA